MIVVIDYKVGNVESVCNAFRHIGCPVGLSREAQAVRGASGLVLPGVAAFGYAMQALGPAAELIREAVGRGTPLLGICVGHQLLFETSSEYGEHDGLRLIEGRVAPIPTDQAVPHMGWNLVELPGDMRLFRDLGPAKHFYFAHSYYTKVTDAQARVVYTEYGFDMAAAVQKRNVYGVQFHPEKSGNTGLRLLKNFYDMCEQRS